MFWINPKLSFPDWRYPQYLYSNHLFVIIMIRSWNHLTLFPLFLYLSYLFPQSHSFVYCLELMIISDMITTYTYVTAATVVIANKILSYLFSFAFGTSFISTCDMQSSFMLPCQPMHSGHGPMKPTELHHQIGHF